MTNFCVGENCGSLGCVKGFRVGYNLARYPDMDRALRRKVVVVECFQFNGLESVFFNLAINYF